MAVQSLSVKPAAAIRTFPVSVVSSVVGIASYVVADILPSGTGFSKVQAMNGGYSGGFFNDGVGASHATVWTTIASASAVDMTPSGLPFLSAATTINSSITGVRKIGGTSLATGNASNGIADHAVVWYNANPASAADINPTGYTASFASGITVDGADLRIVGTAIIGAISHALVWNGVGNTINANTYTDLHSASLTASAALAADGNVQVGNGSVNFGGINALAWNGTAASLTNLQPDPTLYGDSSAVTVVGTRAGGFATTNTTWGSSLLNNKKHAVIWTNLNAGSYVDLQPGTGYTRSYITGINANFEVGAGLNTADNNLHALLWNFNGTQFVDLNTFLPSGFTYKNVEALGIDTNNTVYGYAMDSAGVSHPVVWNVAVPEPTAAAPIALYGIILLRKKRRKNDPA